MFHLRSFSCVKVVWDVLGKKSVRSTIFTLTWGSALLTLLHFLIGLETVDESIYFSSLDLPEDPNTKILGIDDVEYLPKHNTAKILIPKRIHQTWKTDQIPNQMVKWIK